MSYTQAKTTTKTGELLGICYESWFLVALCMADAVSTLLLVRGGLATEYNPFMAWALGIGESFFLLIKVLTFAPFVVVCEIYRRKNPERGRGFILFAALAYLTAYVILVVLVNTGMI